MQLLKRVKWVYVLLSLFLIGVGVCLCLWPDIPSVTICCAIGGGAVLFGIVKIVLYFLHDIEQVGEQNDFAIGAICVIAGAILLIHPGAVLAMIPQVLGVYMLADSMFKLQIALDAKRLDNKGWWLALVITLICIVWGCLLIWQPFGLDRFLTALIAGGLIADGIQNLLGVIFCAATVKKTEAAGGEISEEPEPLIPPVFPVTPSEPVRPDPVPAAPVTPDPVPAPEEPAAPIPEAAPVPEAAPAADPALKKKFRLFGKKKSDPAAVTEPPLVPPDFSRQEEPEEDDGAVAEIKFELQEGETQK